MMELSLRADCAPWTCRVALATVTTRWWERVRAAHSAGRGGTHRVTRPERLLSSGGMVPTKLFPLNSLGRDNRAHG